MDESTFMLQRNTCELLENIAVRIEDITRLYQNDQVVEANQRMVFLTEDLSVLTDAANILSRNFPDLSIGELNEKLSLILEQFEAGDHAYMSDLLLYELLPLLQYWSEILAHVN